MTKEEFDREELRLLRRLEACCRVPEQRRHQTPIPYVLNDLTSLRARAGL